MGQAYSFIGLDGGASIANEPLLIFNIDTFQDKISDRQTGQVSGYLECFLEAVPTEHVITQDSSSDRVKNPEKKMNQICCRNIFFRHQTTGEHIMGATVYRT